VAAGVWGTYAIWHSGVPGPSPSPPPIPPAGPPPPPGVAQLPPSPVVDPHVDLEFGEPVIDGLQMIGPQISLRTGLEVGASTFEGAVPIVRKEIINER
jgi:hypothetical protein